MDQKGSVSSHQDTPVPRCSLGSSSGLRYGALVNSVSSLATLPSDKPPISKRRAYVAIAVLCYVNLLNYMERYTIAGGGISVVVDSGSFANSCLLLPIFSPT